MSADEQAEKASAYDEFVNLGKSLGIGPVGRTYAPKSNVRTREQDEFMSVEKKARESKRQCRARVSLPSRDGKTLVQFECTRLVHTGRDDAGAHTEVGRVRLRNNRTYEYQFFWSELDENEVWRAESEPSTAKPRKITEAENKRMYADVEEGDF